jgi:site-specific recombinase XerD
MVDVDVNWEDPALKRWLSTIKRKGTVYWYKSAFKAYAKFTGMTASALIDEALADAKKDPRERQDVVMSRLVKFYNWLKTEYPVKSRGAGDYRIVKMGVSDKLAHASVGAIRSFYATYDVTVRMRGRHKLPRPRVTNKRMKVGAEQVKVLVDHARTPRDRAIILTLFQSGMDVSTLCSLRHGEVAGGLAEGEIPLKLELHRPKTGVEYYTFLGKDAIEALKAYISDMKARTVQFRNDTALFLKERGKQPLETNLVQNMFREVAVNSGLVDKQNNGNGFNPLGPHALRESFGSLMINSGVPDTIVDFWLGHEIGEMAEAYKGVQYESLKKMYSEREKLLSINPRENLEELRGKLKGEIQEQNKQLQTMANSLVSENLDLKRRIGRTEQKLSELEKLIRQTLEQAS